MESGSDTGTAVESLEALAEEIFRRDQSHDEDGEAELRELMRDFAHPEPEPPVHEEFVREDEFACRSCRMILHRTRLADRTRMICVECATGIPPG
jgi:predicted SprT family Zn-dependent metalloprotease